MAPLQPDIILDKLGPSLFAKNIVFHEALDSTNNLAKELATKGAPEGTMVLAEEQRAGRGRMGRRWVSPGHVNLLFSLLLRPPLPPDQIFRLTMILALATIAGVVEVSGLSPSIKWPNDLYVGHKKLGGILTEFFTKRKAVEYVVLGLGLNVNWSPGEEGILYPATSILAETGTKTPRNELLIGILKAFESHYGRVLTGEIEDFCESWNEFSMIMGKHVEIESGRDKFRGRVLRIDRDGALVLKGNKGKEQKVFSGDVSLRFGDE